MTVKGNILQVVPPKLLRGLIMLGLVLAMGTVGYETIEGWEALDALYMTVITITTVGYKEVRDVSTEGRVFTLVLIFMGMGIMAYTVGMVAQWMVDFQIRSIIGRRKLGRAIKSMKDHYIICGYGRIGKVVAQELESYGIPFVVIDSDTESKQAFEAQGLAYIIDDATNEEVLLEAGVERAKGLVSAVHTNADNMFITMSARVLNPNLFILARADDEQTQKKLLRAGANRVELPYLIGGRKMAHSIVKPAVTDFVDLTLDKGIELRMEELRVGGGSRLNGVTLIDSGIRQQMNVIIVAIRKRDGEMIFNPSSQSRMEADDTLIALGHGQDLKRLADILSGQ